MTIARQMYYFSGFLIILLNCTQDKTPLQYPDNLCEKDRSVYHAIFDSLHTQSSLLVVQKESDVFEHLGDLTEYFPDISPATITGFLTRNNIPQSIRCLPFTTVSVKPLSRDEFQNILLEGGWDLFYSRYPQASGFTTFSLPGYNTGDTQCLVYSSNVVGPLAGWGVLIYLEKETAWTIRAVVMVWIS